MIRGFQWDLARQVERLDWLLAQLPRYAEWGYQELYLHLEDAVEYPSLPGVARRDAYSYRELGRLVASAQRVGIAVVPIVNLLGHTQYLVKVPELQDLNELRAEDGSPLPRGQICPVHPRTLEVADALVRDMAPFCTAGKIHVGLDESFHLGKHPLSRREVEQVGLAAHFGRYVGRLRELTAARGLAMGMWSDMLYFLPGAIPLLPSEVAMYEWYYYPFARRPRVELFNFVETDVGERLAARGHPYWGCPMNGAFRFEPLPHFTDRLQNALSWWKRCRALNAAGFLMTSWEPYRLAIELTTVVDAAVASLWLDGEDDPRRMLEKGFARTGAKSVAKAAAKAALACDRFPFGGYARWQINSRWDVLPRTEKQASYRTEERHFRNLRGAARGLPRPLRASIEFRWYLAARDRLVRELQQERKANRLAELSRAIRVGRRAARAMWRLTRDPGVVGPNEQIVADDAVRLAAARKGRPVFGGEWQVCYRVTNDAPAAQWVGIEQRDASGTWSVRQGCHTIEFQGRYAARRGGAVREHAAPVDWNGDRDRPPELRVVVRGGGKVRVDAVVLTDGRREFQALPPGLIGTASPTTGWPRLEECQVRPIAWKHRTRDNSIRRRGRAHTRRATNDCEG